MGNAFKGQSGLKRIVRAVGYSVQGLRSAYTHENAFRQEVWAAFVMLPASIWLGRSATEILLLAGSVCLVTAYHLMYTNCRKEPKTKPVQRFSCQCCCAWLFGLR
jgi:diacylglycerol kinase (ATP)